MADGTKEQADGVERGHREGEGDADASDEESEYGLRDLARLPLLEQVHRLFHAIQQKYPYKEVRARSDWCLSVPDPPLELTTAPGGQTNAWKTLPVDQKKRMLDYIRDRRTRKPPTESGAVESDAPTPEAAGAPPESSSATADSGAAPSTAAKTDPYLQMLQRRTLRSAPANAATDLHPNSAYVAPAAVAEYAESAREAKKRLKARWKLAESEFYEQECVCGVTHGELSGAKGTLLHTISAMMSTFGDADRSCVTAVEEVQFLGKMMPCAVLRWLMSWMLIYAAPVTFYSWGAYPTETTDDGPRRASCRLVLKGKDRIVQRS